MMGLSTLVLVAGVAAVSGARVHPAARQASRAASHTMMARSTLIAGNWKMNTVLSEALELAAAVKDASASAPGDVAVCVPFPFIEQVGKVLAGSKVGLGAQVRAPARAPLSARARGAAAASPPGRPTTIIPPRTTGLLRVGQGRVHRRGLDGHAQVGRRAVHPDRPL